ncbi:MAG: hypothetical protein JWM21_1230 [Acidobacteria bacterium]|nr:hypothetical protein [Acidobacteriota bacterium]
MNFASNITKGAGGRDATLDRAYDYDRVSPLSVAYAGSEARAFVGTDTWGHPIEALSIGLNNRESDCLSDSVDRHRSMDW